MFFLSAPWLKAQNSYQAGFLPKININKGFENGVGVNLKAESRQILAQGDFLDAPKAAYRFGLADFSLVASRKTGLLSKIAGGYLIRFREQKVVHRAIQQFSVVRRYYGFRIGHRFAADQSFGASQKTELRLRYRLAAEIPLSGEAINQHELYLKPQNEYLNSWQNSQYDLEMRFALLVGYLFSDSNKLEAGLNYRRSDFLASGSKNSFWISLNWYIKI